MTILRFPEPVCDYYGTCPECGRHDGFLNIGPEHWFFCKRHSRKWKAGENLFSGWKEEPGVTHAQNAGYLSDFVEVRPVCRGLRQTGP